MSSDKNKKKDLTRIEDLSDFLHDLNDPETDALLDEAGNDSPDNAPLPDLPDDDQQSIDNLEDDDSKSGPADSFSADFSDSEQEAEENNDFDSSYFDENTDSFQPSDPESSDNEESEETQQEDDPFSFDNNDKDSSEENFSDESFGEQDNTFDNFDGQGEEENDEESNLDTFDSFEPSEAEEEVVELEEEEAQENQEDNLEEDDFSDAFHEGENPNDSPEPSQGPSQKQEIRPIHKRESFEDVRKFAGNLSYGHVKASGNPPFSLAIREILYKEDAEDIIIILREHGLIDQANEKEIRNGLNMGALLLSQLSEYAAIYLAHKLRRFQIDLQIGLSEEIHPAKSYKRTEVGLSSKRNLRRNFSEELELSVDELTSDQIIVTTEAKIESHQILRYLGIVIESQVVDGQALEDVLEVENEESSKKVLNIDHTYNQLIDLLKHKALKKKANAIVGLNFQFSPLINKRENDGDKYKVTATGNAVIVKLDEDDEA